MSSISKQALKVENSTSFPDNNTGYITPSLLRAFNVDMIDSTVNQASYSVDIAAIQSDITALEAFTASQQPSFTALNSFTASQIVTNNALNAFTQSATQELDSLSAWTGSWEAWTSSLNEIRDDGVLQGYSTRFFFNGLVSASVVDNVDGKIANVTIQQDGTKLDTASFNSFSSSVATNLADVSASTAANVIAINAVSTSVNSLYALTGSYATTGSNTFVGKQTVNNEISASQTLYARNIEVPDSTFGGNIHFLTGSSYFNIQLVPTVGDLAFSRDGLSNNKVFTIAGYSGSSTRFENNRVWIENTVPSVQIDSPTLVTANLSAGANLGVTGTSSFSGPISINKGIVSNVQLTGSLNVVGNGDIFLGADPYVVFNGIGLTQTNGNYAMIEYGSSSAIFNFGVVDANAFTYSTELLATATSTGIVFEDFNMGNFSYNTLLTLPQNTGQNPAPVFNRGIVSSGSFIASGSVTITGSVYQNVLPVTISSSTASIDLSRANYFTLTLSGSTNINVTNARPGVTATLVITCGLSGSATFSSNVKQPSGSAYLASPSQSIDIISLTSLDSTTVYAVPAYAFV